MNRKLAFSSFVLLVVLAFPWQTLAEKSGTPGGGAGALDGAAVAGTIYSAEGNKPVMQALVELCDGAGNMLAQEITQENGDFSFHSLERNSYVLRISADGFEATSVEVDLNFSSDRGMAVYLKPTGAKPSDSPVLGTVSAHEASMPKQARESFAAGKKKMYVGKDPQGALADYQAAVKAAPGFYEAYYQMALANLSLKNLADAKAQFRKAVEVSGDKYGEADVSLGTILLDEGESADGEKILRRGIDLSPDFWLGHYELGRAMLNQEKISEALKSAEQARSLAPGEAIVYRLLSNIHLREKDYTALLQDIDAYIKLDPDSPAGLRAKALREQVAQQVPASAQAPPPAKP